MKIHAAKLTLVAIALFGLLMVAGLASAQQYPAATAPSSSCTTGTCPGYMGYTNQWNNVNPSSYIVVPSCGCNSNSYTNASINTSWNSGTCNLVGPADPRLLSNASYNDFNSSFPSTSTPGMVNTANNSCQAAGIVVPSCGCDSNSYCNQSTNTSWCGGTCNLVGPDDPRRMNTAPYNGMDTSFPNHTDPR
jgi:hypothetical protein